MLGNHSVADGQTQPGALTAATACIKGLKDILQNVGIHSATSVAEGNLCLPVPFPESDGKRSAFVHAVQRVHYEIECDGLDLQCVHRGDNLLGWLEYQPFSVTIGQVFGGVEYRLEQLIQRGWLALAFAAPAEFEQPLRNGLAPECLVLKRFQVLVNRFAVRHV